MFECKALNIDIALVKKNCLARRGLQYDRFPRSNVFFSFVATGITAQK